MTLFLTSSPFIDGAPRAIIDEANGFLRLLKESLPEYPRCLYICSDPLRRDLTATYGADVFIAFAEAGIPFSSYHVLDAYHAESARELISSSDLIVLAGGHVPTQNDFFRGLGLAELLETYDGVVMGISAGTMNCAREVYAQPEAPGESDPGFLRFRPGLGLTEVKVCPHYQKVKDDTLDGLRLYRDITFADSMGHTFYVLPDGSFILSRDGKETLYGEAFRIRNGIMEMLTLNGECMPLN